MWMIFSFGSKKSLDFYFKKLMLGMGPRALMNEYWANAVPWIYIPSP